MEELRRGLMDRFLQPLLCRRCGRQGEQPLGRRVVLRKCVEEFFARFCGFEELCGGGDFGGVSVFLGVG